MSGVFLQECEMLRLESEEALKQSCVVERENKRLKLLTGDLSRQVQVRREGGREGGRKEGKTRRGRGRRGNEGEGERE